MVLPVANFPLSSEHDAEKLETVIWLLRLLLAHFETPMLLITQGTTTSCLSSFLSTEQLCFFKSKVFVQQVCRQFLCGCTWPSHCARHGDDALEWRQRHDQYSGKFQMICVAFVLFRLPASCRSPHAIHTGTPDVAPLSTH